MSHHLKELCESSKQCGCIKTWNYVTRDDHGNIHAIKCKFCGTTIMSWRQIGDPEMRKVPDSVNTILVIQKVALLRLGIYREMLIHFDDGSSHATPICEDCITNKTFTTEELEHCHLCDMEDLYKECGNDQQREAHEKFALRQPVRYEEHNFRESIEGIK